MPDDLLTRVAASLAEDLEELTIGYYLASPRVKGQKPEAIAQAIAEDAATECSTEFVETVRQCMGRPSWFQKLLIAQEALPKFVQKQAERATPMALRTVVRLAGPANKDKRTQTTNAQFLLGAAAGLTPTQKAEVNASQEFLAVVKEIFGEAPGRGKSAGGDSP